MTFMKGVPMNGLPGGGPWRIDDDCPAPRHNSIRSAEGRKGEPKCVCPHGVQLYRERLTYFNGKRRGVPRSDFRIKGSVPKDLVDPTPGFFRDAICQHPTFREVMDGGFSTAATKGGVRVRREAKNVCRTHCPIRQQCLEYVQRLESPRGSWGGVWGGQDPWERAGQTMIVTGPNQKVRMVPYVEA